MKKKVDKELNIMLGNQQKLESKMVSFKNFV